MRVSNLITRKRHGGALTSEEIEGLIAGFMEGTVPDYQMAAFLMAVCIRGMTLEETAALTMAMVRSGTTVDLGVLRDRAVDKHSSGGVGDKTSLVLVPLVAAAGVVVPKLSGRGLGHTGGTLDKLESIPGCRTDLSEAEFLRQVEQIGCAIAGQSPTLVPADGKLYALRDVTGTVDSVPLIAASIMSKKLAAGAGSILLDVKCGRGAFMKTEDDARALAETMVEIGRTAARRTVAVISGMDHPLGRAVGNALEVAEAIATLRGDGPPDLEALCLTLGGWMLVLGGKARTPEEGRADLARRLRDGEALSKFAAMVCAQGGDASVVDHPDRLPRAPVRMPVPSPAAGVVAEIDATVVGLAAMRLGAGRAKKGDTIDPAVGIIIERTVGDSVGRGESLAAVHARDEETGRLAAREVAAAFCIAESPPAPPPLVRAVIREQDRAQWGRSQ
ncbi:MAG: thymidine phosphorylase [Armatimonadota bacterium]|nr:thymidine phosphorylase [Armatimonadota bacterium]MDR7549890.1 thymidine phosphorylase [Armatimonadota bacterium]